MAETTGGERWARIDTTAESTAGIQNASPTWAGFRTTGAGFGMQLAKQTIDVTEQANTTTQPAAILSHHAPGGTVDVIPSPWDSGITFGGSPTMGFLKFLFDWALTRTSGVLGSHTIHETQNGILTRQFMGCKINQLTISFSASGGQGAVVGVSLDLVGQFGGRAATALATGAAPTFPSSRHWIVSQASVEMGTQLTNEYDVFTAGENSLEALSITISNNITAGAVGYTYPATAVGAQETRRLGIRDLREGELKVTGNYTIKSENDDWFDRMMESDSTDLTGFLRLLAFHPDSSLFTLTTTALDTDHTGDTATATTTADPSTAVTAGDCVYLEDSTGADSEAWEREVLECVSTTSSTVVLDTDASTDDESLGRDNVYDATGSGRLYSKGLQMRVPQFKVQGIEFPGGASDKVLATVNFEAEADSAGDVFGALVR